MTFLRSLALILLISTAAFADTISGEVQIIREPKPHADHAGETVEVALVKNGNGDRYRITDADSVEILSWLEREKVVLEGEASPGTAPRGSEGVGALDFKVAKVVQPAFEQKMTGVLWSDKAGLSGRRTLQLDDGTEARISGPTFLLLYKLTKDLKKRRIEFSAFKLLGDDGKISKLVIMEVAAKVKEDTILSDPGLGMLLKIVIFPLALADPPKIHGDVKAGETVWAYRRALIGGDVKVRTSDNVSGWLGFDQVEIGEVLPDDADTVHADITDPMDGKPAEGKPAPGAIGGLNH